MKHPQLKPKQNLKLLKLHFLFIIFVGKYIKFYKITVGIQ